MAPQYVNGVFVNNNSSTVPVLDLKTARKAYKQAKKRAAQDEKARRRREKEVREHEKRQERLKKERAAAKAQALKTLHAIASDTHADAEARVEAANALLAYHEC